MVRNQEEVTRLSLAVRYSTASCVFVPVTSQIAAAADRRFDVSRVRPCFVSPRSFVDFNGLILLDPWDKTISIPLLAINSEEYTTGDEFATLLAIAPCVDTHSIYMRALVHRYE